jgi:hypothetical protein
MAADGTEAEMIAERRETQRRSPADRRFGERRRPERAVAGRRVVYANDRRLGGDRRISQSAGYQIV